MAIKTFSDNTGLPASDINLYLANSGLVYITEVSIGTVTTAGVAVSNVFSSAFDHYKIVWNVSSQSTTANFLFWLNAAPAGYHYTSGMYMQPGSSVMNGYNYSAQNTWVIGVWSGGTSSAAGSVEIWNPYLATRTWGNSTSAGPSYMWWGGHQVADTAVNTGFSYAPSAGTITGGTIRVYGIRQA